MSYEIHPETPRGGIPLEEYFHGRDLAPMHEMLTARTAALGLPFAPPRLLANSRIALLAVEHAREAGLADALSRRIFSAYFAEGRNIGELDELSALAEGVGLDPDPLRNAVLNEVHADRIAEAAQRARRLGITGVPTFFISPPHTDGTSPPPVRRIVGAQPLEVFQGALAER